MSTTFTPTDDFIGPIATALGNELSAQILTLGRVYTTVPDGPLEDNCVLLPLSKFKFEEDTIGKMYVRLTFSVRYLVRRSMRFSDDMVRLYQMFSAFSKVLSSWSNQNVAGLGIQVFPKDGGFTQFTESGTPYAGMIMNTEVLMEFNLLLS